MTKVKHILELTKVERQSFLDSFDTVISDCDGVLWHFSGPLTGAKEGLEVIRSQGKQLLYVSNNSFNSRSSYEEKFQSLGVQFDYTRDLIHPATATVDYLRQINVTGPVYVIGSEAFIQVLESAGIQCFSMPSTTKMTTLHDVMSLVNGAPKVSAVVYDVDLNFNLTKFYAAQHFLSVSPECPLIFGATDKTFLYKGRQYAGVGLFMEALLSQATQKAIVLGKPNEKLSELVVQKFGIKDRSRVLFIGDTLHQDIGFANVSGFQSLLVLSGATSKEVFQANSNSQETPSYYADSLFDFVALLGTEDQGSTVENRNVERL